jgi:Protein of unknown function (DUF1499)
MAEENVDTMQPGFGVEENMLVKPASDWFGKILFLLGIGAPLWGFIAAMGARLGFWGWEPGLAHVQYSFFLALGVILIGFTRYWFSRGKGIFQSRLLRLGGIAAAFAYALWIGSFILKAMSVPFIHDISTDLADPPQFRVLELRKDNLDNVPGADDPDMKGFNPQQRWESLHRDAYADIRTVRIGQPVADVIAKAERIAKARGWDIALADPVEGRFEATEASALFNFKDDVVLRVRPTEDATGSVVDMRSVSRVGVSDLGVNAKRVRSFLADLSGTVSAGK